MTEAFWTNPVWWLALVLGVMLGLLFAWLLLRRQMQQAAQGRLEAELALKHQTEQQSTREREWQQQRQRWEQLEADYHELSQRYATVQESYRQLQQRLQERIAEVGQMQEQFKLQFETISRQIVDQNARRIQDSQHQRLGQLLDPLKERLQQFEQKLQHAYETENRERFSLRREIERLYTLNQQMSEEARNLTRALKGDRKTQGNWGELVLARVLENSGLREGEEYVSQSRGLGLRNDDGQVQQPDVIIKLPEDKHLIIDAKVSLSAYERFQATEAEADRQQALSEHLLAVRRHVQQLSDKHYAQLNGLNSPEFVLMFMPIEPAFHLAVQAEQDLFSFAWDRKIVLVSPTTLLATLRTVASVWKLEHRNQHAEEIARQGGRLYDKFVGFVEELDNVGTHLERALRAQSTAMNRLRDGRGSLMRKAEQLRELGVRNQKQLPRDGE